MQYTRPMIDLVYEIRRRVDSEMKPSVKMANPDMLKELAEYHHRTKETITKTLIKELLFLAGTEWAELLEPIKSDKHKLAEHPKQVVKVYRGQTILVDAQQPAKVIYSASEDANLHNEMTIKNIPHATAKPVRMYRGHPIVN